MEFVVLNDLFLPARMVENHESLIWTERYSTNGDFERVSEDVGGTLAALPLYTFDIVNHVQKPTVVSLRDTDVPMIVETHKIEWTSTSPAKITTTGRSFETVLDRRTTVNKPLGGGAPIKAWTSVQKSAVDAAYDVMNQVVTIGLSNVDDRIPEITIKAPIRPSDYVVPTADQNYQVDPGELYAWVMQQLQSENYGLRAVRPSDLDTTTISIEIYSGVDRTKDVVFDARFGQFDNATYLLSQAGLKTADQVTGATDSFEVTNGSSGLNRRVTYFDGSSLVTSSPSDTTTNILRNLGTVDLARHLETVLFDGEVSRQMGARYGKDFHLGDIVKLTGNYGLSQFVRISEFIRSEDNSGEKAYPTFTSL